MDEDIILLLYVIRKSYDIFKKFIIIIVSPIFLFPNGRTVPFKFLLP